MLKLLLFPVLGGPILVHWLVDAIATEVEHELFDEGPIRGELLRLQEQYEEGFLDEEEYTQQERTLLERLQTIRDYMARRLA